MYGKIFAQMYEGTLASKGPWQALVTFQQMIVLANKHGEVDMTPEAIAARTTIPLDIIKIGIETLEQPDPFSRTPGEEGRRIVHLDEHRPWGWRIVNYTKYRQLQSNEDRREYFRLQKQKQRAKAETSEMSTMSTNVHTCPPPSTDVTEAVSSKQLKPYAHSSSAPDGFEVFWKAYPNKVARKRAMRAFRKIKPEELPKIMACLEAQKRTEQWRKDGGSFIPHPSTWLNDERWKDEIQTTTHELAPKRRNELTEEDRKTYARYGVTV